MNRKELSNARTFITDEPQTRAATLDDVIRATENKMQSLYFDPQRFEQVKALAEMLADASVVPDSLKTERRKQGNGWEQVDLDRKQVVANVFLVVNRALRWECDPVALLDEAYVVGGKLAFSGKTIAAVVNRHANLKGPLEYVHVGGKGESFKVRCSGTLRNESQPRSVEMTVKQGVNQAGRRNEMWTRDPFQKLCYTLAIRWARRHAPGVILGVYSVDELKGDLVGAVREIGIGQPISSLDALTERLAADYDPDEDIEPEAQAAPEDEPENVQADPDGLEPWQREALAKEREES